MEIIIKRIIMREDCTIGCVQVHLSGNYKSKLLEPHQLRASPWGSSWVLVGDTLEHQAIPWVDRPLIGDFVPERIPRDVALPEDQYKAYLLDSKRYKGKVLKLESPGFVKGTILRPGSKPQTRHSEIIVGHLVPVSGGHPTDKPVMNGEHEAMNLLCELIEEAKSHSEKVTVTVRSPREWTGPNYKIKRRYNKTKPLPRADGGEFILLGAEE